MPAAPAPTPLLEVDAKPGLPAGAPSYFTSDSMIRRVHREWAVALAGPRALLMQATHPVAFAGFFAHTGALDEPYERLQRTAEVMSTIVFGPKGEADRMTRRVRVIHSRIRGELREPVGRFPAGTPYRADDPELLLWIVATLVDSALVVFERYVRSLSREERQAYWDDYRVVARLFGLTDDDLPPAIEDLEDHVRATLASGDLAVGPLARELAIDIVLKPPVPLWARPLLETANQITTGLLPAEVRRLYGFGWDPARAVAVRGGAEYLKRFVLPFLPGAIRHTPSWRAAA